VYAAPGTLELGKDAGLEVLGELGRGDQAVVYRARRGGAGLAVRTTRIGRGTAKDHTRDVLQTQSALYYYAGSGVVRTLRPIDSLLFSALQVWPVNRLGLTSQRVRSLASVAGGGGRRAYRHPERTGGRHHQRRGGGTPRLRRDAGHFAGTGRRRSLRFQAGRPEPCHGSPAVTFA
jgi:hypothetical protein